MCTTRLTLTILEREKLCSLSNSHSTETWQVKGRTRKIICFLGAFQGRMLLSVKITKNDSALVCGLALAKVSLFWILAYNVPYNEVERKVRKT